MNAKQACDALEHLIGQRIVVFRNGGEEEALVIAQDCHSVDELKPEERVDGAGNVILWDGGYDQQGRPSGITFQAGNLHQVLRYGPCYTQLITKNTDTKPSWIYSVAEIVEEDSDVE